MSPGGTLLVIDCGTGAHDLGRTLMADAKGNPQRGNILISHTHWDHIQGFPFFVPLFIPGWHWDIYGPAGLGRSLRVALAGQMQHTYFPVTLDEMGAGSHFHNLIEGQFSIGDIEITTRYLNHPALTLGYRLEMDGLTVVYSCDHEPYDRNPGGGPSDRLHELDERHIDFLKGADLLIHDSQFTDKEYENRRGWGHSPVEYVCEMAELAGVKRLALTHHDPTRTDDDLDEIAREAQATMQAAGSTMEVFAAADGQVLELDGPGAQLSTSDRSKLQSALVGESAMGEASVYIVVGDEGTRDTLARAASVAGVSLARATDGAGLLSMVESSPPSLVIVEEQMPDMDGLELCRRLRAHSDPYLKALPVVVVADEERREEGLEAGVTRWLIRPFSLQYAQAHIQAWILRAACRWMAPPKPPDEEDRLAALRALAVLDTPPEERFDRITRVAATLAEVPISLVSLIDKDRQWFKSCHGLDVSETPRELAFCAHAVARRERLIVPDTLLDDRFADNPLVTGGPRIRFYAGFPIFAADGSCVGTLCLIDTRPRQFTNELLHRFEDLAAMVQQELNEVSLADLSVD